MLASAKTSRKLMESGQLLAIRSTRGEHVVCDVRLDPYQIVVLTFCHECRRRNVADLLWRPVERFFASPPVVWAVSVEAPERL